MMDSKMFQKYIFFSVYLMDLDLTLCLLLKIEVEIENVSGTSIFEWMKNAQISALQVNFFNSVPFTSYA